jgi:hypothetical protein
MGFVDAIVELACLSLVFALSLWGTAKSRHEGSRQLFSLAIFARLLGAGLALAETYSHVFLTPFYQGDVGIFPFYLLAIAGLRVRGFSWKALLSIIPLLAVDALSVILVINPSLIPFRASIPSGAMGIGAGLTVGLFALATFAAKGKEA